MPEEREAIATSLKGDRVRDLGDETRLSHGIPLGPIRLRGGGFLGRVERTLLSSM